LDFDSGRLVGLAVSVAGIGLDAVRGVAEAVVLKYTDRSRDAKP
jgi:hypothetical protein